LTVTICESSDHGHRLNYVGYFQREAALLGKASRVEPSLTRALLAPGPLVLPMLEQRTVANLLVMALRSIFGRKTLCLVFRATQAAGGDDARLAFKRVLLSAVRRMPGGGLVSIVPVPVEPAIAQMVNGWIYDPELCDIAADDFSRTPSAEVASYGKQAAGRAIVVALGRQAGGKGFDFFSDLWTSSDDLRRRFLFIAAGTVPAELSAHAERFTAAGGVLVNRRISDEELLDFYAIADGVWCCYAPDYDQASGIFGRAVQFAKMAVVRRGSHLERFAQVLEHPAESIGWGDLAGAAQALLAAESSARIERPRGVRNADMNRVNRAVLARYLA